MIIISVFRSAVFGKSDIYLTRQSSKSNQIKRLLLQRANFMYNLIFFISQKAQQPIEKKPGYVISNCF